MWAVIDGGRKKSVRGGYRTRGLEIHKLREEEVDEKVKKEGEKEEEEIGDGEEEMEVWVRKIRNRKETREERKMDK